MKDNVKNIGILKEWKYAVDDSDLEKTILFRK